VVAPGAKPAAAIVPLPPTVVPPQSKAPDHFTMEKDNSSDLNKAQ
jgi:hypothetical protein